MEDRAIFLQKSVFLDNCTNNDEQLLNIECFAVATSLHRASPLFEQASMEPSVKSLFASLKRSYAGTREHQIRILQSLGLRRREKTVHLENNASVRGALDKVKHLILLETDRAYHERKKLEVAAKAYRGPVVVKH